MKFEGLVIRFIDIFRFFPKRIIRLVRHLFRNPFQRPLVWFFDISTLFLDTFGLPELYETLADFFKWNTRPLTSHELTIAKSIFGDSINYKRVRMDTKAYFGPKKGKFAYVSFYTINSWGVLSDKTFIHEMTHIWQYEKMGAKYIPHALLAQRTIEGYDYGGIDGINHYLGNGKQLKDFNLEQQGDIVADYFVLKQQKNAGLIAFGHSDLGSFEKIMETM